MGEFFFHHKDVQGLFPGETHQEIYGNSYKKSEVLNKTSGYRKPIQQVDFSYP